MFGYEVIELETLSPFAIEEMTGGNWDLTLFTCTVGGQYRVTVRCVLANGGALTTENLYNAFGNGNPVLSGPAVLLFNGQGLVRIFVYWRPQQT